MLKDARNNKIKNENVRELTGSFNEKIKILSLMFWADIHIIGSSTVMMY